MGRHILICDCDNPLPAHLPTHKVILKSGTMTQAAQVVGNIREKARIPGVWLQLGKLLKDIAFPEELSSIPLYIELPGLGEFREWHEQLSFLRDRNVFILLNAAHTNTYRDLLILSSLKVHCGIKFGPRPPDWEALTDLATYSVYGKSEHAPIQPFQYAVSNYAPDRYVNINHVYFNDPSRFIHIGKNETLALSEKELAEGNILAQGLDQLESLPNCPEYQERLQGWRKHFLDVSTCSSCPAWRLCLGNFESHISSGMNCREFFIELLEAAEFYQNVKKDQEKPFNRNDPSPYWFLASR